MDAHHYKVLTAEALPGRKDAKALQHRVYISHIAVIGYGMDGTINFYSEDERIIADAEIIAQRSPSANGDGWKDDARCLGKINLPLELAIQTVIAGNIFNFGRKRLQRAADSLIELIQEEEKK